MSFYRSLLAVVAAVAITTPVFADDTNTDAANNPSNNTTQTIADNSASDTSATDQSTSEQIKININKASAKDLMKIKGINASKARSIVAYRKKHGEFKSTEDLNNVKGFKKLNSDNLKEIQDQLTVE